MLRGNFALVLAFTVPLLLLLIVLLIFYLPSYFFEPTEYNFVYLYCYQSSYDHYCADYMRAAYVVVDGKLVVRTAEELKEIFADDISSHALTRGKYNPQNYDVRVFLYDVKKKQSRQISLQEAQRLKLSSLLTSPDGASITSGYGKSIPGDFIFTSRGYEFYLVKDGKKKKIELVGTVNGFSRNRFHFVGWVLPDNP